MTIQDAIDRARGLQDTEMTDEEMCRILSAHDEQLLDSVLSKYFMKEEWTRNYPSLPYTQFIGADTGGANDFDQELIIPEKYGDMIYPYLLLWHIDLAHADYERYNNNVQTYSFHRQQMLNDITRDHAVRPPDRRQERARPWASTQIKF